MDDQPDHNPEWDAHGDELKEDLLRGSAILGHPGHSEVMEARQMFWNLVGYISAEMPPEDWDDKQLAEYARGTVRALLTLRNEIRMTFDGVLNEPDETVH